MSHNRKTRKPSGANETGVPKQQFKLCPVCRLPFHNRRKWASRGQWDAVVYCSERCRRQASDL